MPEISAYIQEEKRKNHSLPFIALTETWLKSYMSDAQLHIPGYTVSRSDRGSRVGGGVLLYSHVNIPVSEYDLFLMMVLARDYFVGSVQSKHVSSLRTGLQMPPFLVSTQ